MGRGAHGLPFFFAVADWFKRKHTCRLPVVEKPLPYRPSPTAATQPPGTFEKEAEGKGKSGRFGEA